MNNAAATHVPPTSRKSDLPAVGLVLLSAAGFGSLCVVAQLAYDKGVSVLGLLTGRYVIAGALLWLIALALRRPLPSLRGLGIGIALGAGYAPMALCFATSLHHIEAGLADLLLFAYPVVVAVGAVALGRERWHRRRAVALAVAAAGIVLAVAGSGAISPLGVALALISAAIYAAYVLASASLLGRLDPLVLAAAISTGAAMVLAADAGLRGQLAPRGGAAGLGLIVAAALFASVLATSAFMAGVRKLGASRASIVSSAEPAFTAVFAFAAFGQRFDLVQLLGATLVLASIPILELRRAATEQHHIRQPANGETTMYTQLAYEAQTAVIKERTSNAALAQEAQLIRRRRQARLATGIHVPGRRFRAVAQLLGIGPDNKTEQSSDVLVAGSIPHAPAKHGARRIRATEAIQPDHAPATRARPCATTAPELEQAIGTAR